MHLDIDSHNRIVADRVARLTADYDGTQSSGSRTLSRLVFLTIVIAIAAGLAVTSAHAANVGPSFRLSAKPASHALVRIQATVPAFRVNYLGVRPERVLVHAASTCTKQQHCKPAS